MTSLDSIVRDEIRRRGRVPFSEFMGWALGHPRHGYYTRRIRTGRRGDFVTNVQTGPLFGRLLSETFANMWDALGSQRFTLVELGAGDGALAESVLRALEERGRAKEVRLHVVEQSPTALRAARRRLSRYGNVHYHGSLPEMEHTAGVEGCVYSNEFFDALPFHRVVWSGGQWRELWVEGEGETLVERPGPLSEGLAGVLAGQTLAEGQSMEVCLVLEEVLEHVARILSRGFVFTVDYGGFFGDRGGDLRPQGTRRTYSAHAVGDDPFTEIGEKDITAHVDFERMISLGIALEMPPLILARQGAYFLKAGEKVLRSWVEGASEADRPRVARQVQQLIHPHAFGTAFKVLIQGKNVGGITLPGGGVEHSVMLPISK